MTAALRLLGRRAPRVGLLTAHALARTTERLGFGIAIDRLADVFPGLDAAQLRAARASSWGVFLKGVVVGAATGHGGPRRFRLRDVPSPQLASLDPPAIIITFHTGPFETLGGGLRMLKSEPIALTRDQFASSPGVSMVAAGETTWERAATFRRALTQLRSGGFVMLNVDAFHDDEFPVSSVDAPLLGRTLPLARGAFALARISEAPIVPVATRWRGLAVEYVVGDPIPATGDEAAMAAAAAGWLERYLRERPGELSVFLLDRLRP